MVLRASSILLEHAVLKAMAFNDGNRTQAAKDLNLYRTSIPRILNRYEQRVQSEIGFQEWLEKHMAACDKSESCNICQPQEVNSKCE